MMSRILRVGLAFAVLVLLTSCGMLPRPAAGAIDADSFVAVDLHSVDAVSATTGQVERELMPTVRGDFRVRGVSLRGQALFVTYAAGPDCTGGVAGCGPAPDTCGAQVVRFDLAAGSRRVVWKVGQDTLLTGAVPSPDGTRIAALVSPCVPSFLNQHLVVRDLAGGQELSIGAGLPRCHVLGGPQWTGDGARIVMLYASAMGPAWTGADGTCSATHRTQLLVLDATRAEPGVTGVSRSAPTGCQYASVAVRADDVYAVRDCRSAGRTTLEHLTPQLVPGRSWPLGRSDGTSIAVGPSGDVLVAAYQSRTTTTTLTRFSASGTPTRVSAVSGIGEIVPDQLAW